MSAIGEALRGGERDLTEGSLPRAITVLAIPMMLEMAMESLLGVVDAFFVAPLGSAAVAAVGITESLGTIVFALAMGLATATTAMIARRIGERDRDAAARTAVQAIAAGIGLALPIAVLGALLAPSLLRVMGATSDVVATGKHFTAVMLGGNVFVFVLFLINAIFRGAGDATTAMRALWLAHGVNIVLDPILIGVLGVTGAAVATTIARAAGIAYQLHALSRGRIRVRRQHLSLDPRLMLRLLRLSAGAVAAILIATASWVGLTRILSAFGPQVLAGYTIGLRIVFFAILPAWGLSNAVATLVGQNLGAARPARAERAAWTAGLGNMIFLGAVGIVLATFAEPLLRFFTSEPEVVRTGVRFLRIASVGYPLYAWGMVMGQALSGAGDNTTPSAINLLAYWIWEIPLAWFLSRVCGLGAEGVFWAITIAECTCALGFVLAFRRGAWKRRTV
jgi:putative MATE family efflux protein